MKRTYLYLILILLNEAQIMIAQKPVYEITAPLLDKETLYLNNYYYPGEKFVIKTINDPEKNIYIRKALLNGKKWDACWFYHDDFAKGGELELELGNQPNKKWGIKSPPTMSPKYP